MVLKLNKYREFEDICKEFIDRPRYIKKAALRVYSCYLAFSLIAVRDV
jgi:hypothetical protein